MDITHLTLRTKEYISFRLLYESMIGPNGLKIRPGYEVTRRFPKATEKLRNKEENGIN